MSFSLLLVVLPFLSGLCLTSANDICRMAANEHSKSSQWKSTIASPEYSAQMTPTKDNTDYIYTALQILDLDDINEMNMYFRVQLFIISAWKDKRLDTSGLTESILLPYEAYPCFWTPSTIFENNKDGKMFDLSVPNEMMTVYKNKTIIRVARFSLKIKCKMDLSRYSMDVQNCDLRTTLFEEADDVVSLKWMNDTSRGLDFRFLLTNNSSVDVSKNISPTRFIMTKCHVFNKTKTWLNHNFTLLGLKFTFVRRLTSSLLTVYIPSTLTVCLSWVSFWIDVKGIPGRVSLGIMSILTIITQILDVRKNMPPVSYVTAIDIWLFACLNAVFFSLIEYALAYNYVRRRETETKREVIPTQKTNVTINGRQRWAMIPVGPRTQQANEARTHKTLLNTVLNSLHIHKLNSIDYSTSNLDNNCKLTFPILFTIFAVVYWTYYLLTTQINNKTTD